MNELLLQSPVILTDDIFAEYGGDTGSAAAGIRQNAYAIAETMAQQSVHCFLTPTIVTGTYPISVDGIYQLEYAALREVKSVRFWSMDGSCDKVFADGCATVIDSTNSVVRISATNCTCGKYGVSGAEKVDIVYESGVDAGTFPNVRLGLVIAAKKILEQITDPDAALGGAGDPEVKSFGDTGLSMSYGKFVKSVFGGSPEMQLATRLVRTSLPRRMIFRR